MIHFLLIKQLGHLIAHYGAVGGDKEVIGAAKVVQIYLFRLAELLKLIAASPPDGT